MSRGTAVAAILLVAGSACSAPPETMGAVDAAPGDDAGPPAPSDAGRAASDGATPDADAGAPCSVGDAPGVCIGVTECAALPGHTSTPGLCPGSAEIRCCAATPSVADDPPIPPGYRLMMQSEVTADMTAWAVAILHDPVTYPMFATAMRSFGTQPVLARVEWHPPDFLNSAVHRGVTLYVPL